MISSRCSVQLREPQRGWRPAAEDTTLPFDSYVRHLPPVGLVSRLNVVLYSMSYL